MTEKQKVDLKDAVDYIVGDKGRGSHPTKLLLCDETIFIGVKNPENICKTFYFGLKQSSAQFARRESKEDGFMTTLPEAQWTKGSL